MNVILAGFNVDRNSGTECESPTPETIAAAYARISRSPLAVDELRAIATRDVDQARRSNEKIVFEMGHSSIAEHAVFNIDIIGVSRLLVEEIERFRLVSFTEKSQRYCLFENDFTLPTEINASNLNSVFTATIRRQQQFYRHAYNEITAQFGHEPRAENKAKEDARYAIPLATHTQLGMTINARNLESMIRRLAAHPLMEAQELAEKLSSVTHPVAPSLIRYTAPTTYDRRLFAHEPLNFGASITITGEEGAEDVTLLWVTPDADIRLAAAILYRRTTESYDTCRQLAGHLSERERAKVIAETFRHMHAYDPVWREFEIPELVFALKVSASCFAQLKRHRMATIITQPYEPALGVMMPESMVITGLKEEFLAVMEETDVTYRRIKEAIPAVAPYILTNAHKRRLLMKVNARELYHMGRLRMDTHAQWDIRRTVTKMVTLASQEMPLTMMFACGRDAFSDAYAALFQKEEGNNK